MGDKQQKSADHNNSVPCGECGRICDENPGEFKDESMECDCCHRWIHMICAKMQKGKRDAISKYKLRWFCDKCEVGAASLYEMCVGIRAEQVKLREDVSKLETRVKNCEDEGSLTRTRLTTCEKTNSELSTRISNVKTSVLSDLKTDTSENNPLITLKNELKAEIAASKQQTPWKSSSAGPTPDLRKIINDEVKEEVKEAKALQAIKNNIIISGIPESDNDEANVNKLISEELGIVPEIDTTQRLGKPNPDRPRLLKVIVSNSENRQKILLKAKDLRKSTCKETREKVYIRPDQTKKQQLESKNLRDDLRARRLQNPTKTYRIVKGVIEETETPPTTS